MTSSKIGKTVKCEPRMLSVRAIEDFGEPLTHQGKSRIVLFLTTKPQDHNFWYSCIQIISVLPPGSVHTSAKWILKLFNRKTFPNHFISVINLICICVDTDFSQKICDTLMKVSRRGSVTKFKTEKALSTRKLLSCEPGGTINSKP